MINLKFFAPDAGNLPVIMMWKMRSCSVLTVVLMKIWKSATCFRYVTPPGPVSVPMKAENRISLMRMFLLMNEQERVGFPHHLAPFDKRIRIPEEPCFFTIHTLYGVVAGIIG